MIIVPFGVELDLPSMSRHMLDSVDEERCASCNVLLDVDDVDEGEEYCEVCRDEGGW